MKKEFVIALTASGVILTTISGAHLLQANPKSTTDIPHVSPFGTLGGNNLSTLSTQTVFPKKGNQKVLTVLVNLSDSPFTKDEKYYSDMLYGSGVDSLKSYIESQSNGKMTISPVTTKGTQHQGIIKVDVDSKDAGTIKFQDYAAQVKYAQKILEQVKDKIDFSSADTNGDKKFNDSWLVDKPNDADELFINIVFSGSVSDEGTGNDKIQAWPHTTEFNATINGYSLKNSGLITSEKYNGNVIGLSTFAHEFLHNLNARDMYNDKNAVGMWSVMGKSYGNREGSELGFHANPLDPLHKLRMGWTTPVKVDLSKPTNKIKFDKTKTYYIEHPTNKDVIYLLDYRDFDDIYEKANYRYGLREDGLIIWQLNKNSLTADWNDDWQFNTQGMRSSLLVVPKKSGQGPTVENTLHGVGDNFNLAGLYDITFQVNNNEVVIKSVTSEPEVMYEINAIDRKFKKGAKVSKAKLLEGVTVTGSDGSDVTKTSNLDVTNTVVADKEGDYTATYTANVNGQSLTKTIKVTIESDNKVMKPPVINAEDKQIVQGSKWDPKEGVTAKDGNGKDITKDLQVYEDTVKPDTPGRYIVVYGVKDSLEQETVKDIVVTVLKEGEQAPEKPEKDTTPPVIHGVEKKVIKVGEKFKPLEGVTATDNVDEVVEVRVKSSNVDNKTPGTYKVVYEAVDKAGNKTTVERTIQVITDETSGTQPTEDKVAPVIKTTGDNIKIPEGSELDPLTLVTAEDNKDGDISHLIKITKSDLDLNKPGKYSITYSVSDKAGNTTTLTVNIEVIKSEIQFIVPDIKIHQGSKFKPKADIKVLDSNGKDVTEEVKVSGKVNTEELGVYKIKYTYTDKNGVKYSHIRTVEVVSKDVNIEPPTIKVDYRVIKVGTNFNVLDGISAKASDGTDITKSIKLKSGEIDTNTVGMYPLIYTVEDKDGNITEIDRNMLVLPMDIDSGSPHIFITTNKIELGSSFDPKAIVVGIDKEDGLLTDVVVKVNNVDTSKLGVYTIEYSVIDKEGNVTNQSFDIEVVDKVVVDDAEQDIDTPLEGGELGVGTEDNSYELPTTGTVASGGLLAGFTATLSGVILAIRNRRK